MLYLVQDGIANNYKTMQKASFKQYKLMKLKIGDKLMVLGTSHFEVSTISSIEKEVVTLDNGLKVDLQLTPLGNSKYKISLFNEEEYQYLSALNKIPKLLEDIKLNYKNLSKDNLIKVYNRLDRLTSKF